MGLFLGLFYFKKDVFCILFYVEYFFDRFFKVEILVLFLCVRFVGIDFVLFYSVCDKDFIKFLIIVRLYFLRVGIVIFIREDVCFCDVFIDVCIIKMLVGFKIIVGGYVV